MRDNRAVNMAGGYNGNGKPRLMESFLHVRQSFARFSPQDIPEEYLEHVFELARLSPSKWNL